LVGFISSGHAVAAAVFAGGAIAGILEGFAEAAHGAEAGIEGDAEDLLIGGGEESLRMGNAMLGEVVDKGHAGRFAEEAHGIVGVEANGAADCFDSEVFGVTLRDKTGHLLDLAEPAFTDDEAATGFFSGWTIFGGKLPCAGDGLPSLEGLPSSDRGRAF